MKVLALTLLALLCCSALANSNFDQYAFKRSDDVFKFVDTTNFAVYVLFLYNGDWASTEVHHPMKARYDLEKEEIRRIIGKYGSAIHFSEINVNSGDYSHLLSAIGIEPEDLNEYPMTVATDGVLGVWVQGPREYHRIGQVIDGFVTNQRSNN